MRFDASGSFFGCQTCTLLVLACSFSNICKMKIRSNTPKGGIACAIVALVTVSGCSRAIPETTPPASAKPITKKPVAVPKPASKPAPKTLPKPVSPPMNSGPLQPAGPWTSWPLAAGNWTYGTGNKTTFALYGQPQRDPLVVIRCETALKKITFARVLEFSKGAAPNMRVRASDGLQSWPTRIVSTGPGVDTYHGVTLLPTDAMLDMITFSRGRFAVEVDGEAGLALPAWPEMARVIEDCR